MENLKSLVAVIGVLSAGLSSPAFANPVVTSVVNGASFIPAMSPGCLISIFGTGLAPNLQNASTVPLPTSLLNTSVRIAGIEAPLYFVSPTQINAQVPFEVATMIDANVQFGTVSVVVTSNQASNLAFNITISAAWPALFTVASNGAGQALYVDPNFQSFSTPLVPGATIILYATGLGQTSPPATTGAGGLANQPLLNFPTVYIGETQAQVMYAGLAPHFVGVYQLNVVVPSNLATNRLVLAVGNQRSNVTSAVITAGTNTTNASGILDALYPTAPGQQPASSPLIFSPLLIAAQFTAKFTLASGAQPFALAAVSEGGSSIILVNPAAGTMSGSATVPTPQTDVLNFNNSGILPIDFINGLPFPNSVIPESFFDEVAGTALAAMPTVNVPPPLGTSTGAFQTTASVLPGATVAIDQQNNSGFASFAGWLVIPYAPYFTERSTALELFIDGSLVATPQVPYTTATTF
jgi:uncharacterized protein (TIGR03437 family)